MNSEPNPGTEAATAPILSLRGVSKVFAREPGLAGRIAGLLGAEVDRRAVRAVDGVNLDIRPGEVVGLVGESGCGKSTLARVAAGLMAPSGGDVLFEGESVAAMGGAERRRADLAVQLVFQDAAAALNPRMRVLDLVGEAPLVHGLTTRGGMEDYVAGVLARVGLDRSALRRFPHQFSGGQRARVGIARALAVNPRVLVLDESVAALDVSIQAQVLNLFMELRGSLGLTYLFVSHDLGVIEHVADRVAVMYLGRLVEEAPAEAFFAGPNHPYARALLAEVPRLEPGRRRFTALKGELPSPLDPPPGCHFHPRCPHAFSRCRVEIPALEPVGPGRRSACHLNDEPVAEHAEDPAREAATLN